MLYIIKLNFKIIINLLEMLMELFILFYGKLMGTL